MSAFDVFVYVSLVLGLAGSFDVLSQPRKAFRASGHSKLRWFLIESIGCLFLLGAATWAVYSFAVRPTVVAAGGRTRKKLRAFYAVLNRLDSSHGPTDWRPSVPMRPTRATSREAEYPPVQTKQKCSCNNGKVTHYPCQGLGYFNLSDGRTETCHGCGGSGGLMCAMCSGTGYRS